MNKMLLENILALVMVSVSTIWGYSYYANDNKLLIVTPQYSALGGAGITFTSDATPMSNPANLSLPGKNSLNLGYTGYYLNAFSTSLGSFTFHLSDKLGIGASFGYIFIPDIELTDKSLVDPSTGDIKLVQTTATSSEMFLNIGAGYTFVLSQKVHLAAGAALHCQRRRLIDWTGYGIGADAGLTFHFTKTGIRLSLLFDDLTTNYIHWSASYHDNSLPHARFGFGWRKDLPYIYGSISLMYKTPDLFSNEGVEYNFLSGDQGVDAVPENYSLRERPSLLFTAACMGFEYNIYRVFTIRAGVDEIKRIHFGAGVNLFSQTLPIDFAYMVAGDLPGTYAVSVGYYW